MSAYCFDTDVLSATLRRDPPMHLVRRLVLVPAVDQATTAITAGELLYGAAKRGTPALEARVREILQSALAILPFDAEAAEVYGSLRAELESAGRRLAEPDLRIAAIALARGVTLVTGNVRHFARVPGLEIENGSRSHVRRWWSRWIGRSLRLPPSRACTSLDPRSRPSTLCPAPAPRKFSRCSCKPSPVPPMGAAGGQGRQGDRSAPYVI